MRLSRHLASSCLPAVCVLAGALLSAQPARAQVSFSYITLDPGFASVFGFNDSLQVYGNDSDGNVVLSGPQAQGITNLGTLDATFNQNSPYAINNRGQVAGFGFIGSGDVNHAFLSGPNGLMDLGALSNNLDPTRDLNSYAYSINNLGQVTGASETPYDAGGGFVLNVSHPFLYQNGVMTDLGGIPNSGDPSGVSANATAFGINDAGVIVGDGDTEVDGGVIEDHAFVYQNGQYATLGTFDNTVQSIATGINNFNQIIGYSTYAFGNVSDVHAFLHNGTGLLTAGDDIGTFGGANSYAFAVNDHGQVIGSAEDASGALQPFLYQNHTLFNINDFVPASADLSDLLIYGINNNGQILGSGTDANGNSRFFVLTTPEPGALALAGALGLFLPGLLARKRRERKRVVAS